MPKPIIDAMKKSADYLPANTAICHVVGSGLGRLYDSRGIPALSGYTQEELVEEEQKNAMGLRLQRVYGNLLGSAIQFAPPGGRADLAVECLAAESDGANGRVTVQDNGCGMAAHLSKPIDPRELYATLMRTIGAYRKAPAEEA